MNWLWPTQKWSPTDQDYFDNSYFTIMALTAATQLLSSLPLRIHFYGLPGFVPNSVGCTWQRAHDGPLCYSRCCPFGVPIGVCLSLYAAGVKLVSLQAGATPGPLQTNP